jgi:DNA processing protein
MNTQVAVLQLMLAKGVGQRTLFRLLERLRSENYFVSDFVDAPISEMTGPFALKPESADSIKAVREEATALTEELDRHSVRTLVLGTSDYPSYLEESLGKSAPPVLFAAGDMSVLERKGVGFCGSRKASERSCRIIEACASDFSRQGYNVVSGYAYGVDLAAHYGALKGGGVTTFVMATGILHFRPKKAIADLLREDNFLVLSEFSPKLGWSVQNAMQRNKTIIGLTQVMILAEAGSNGGTFEAGMTTLELQRPLFVIDPPDSQQQSEGDKLFLQRGAKLLRVSENETPILDGVTAQLESARPDQCGKQISFF